jgi:hypothetical protein
VAPPVNPHVYFLTDSTPPPQPAHRLGQPAEVKRGEDGDEIDEPMETPPGRTAHSPERRHHGQGRPDIPMIHVFRGVTPFAIICLCAVFLLTAAPSIALWLPSLV